MHVAKDKNAERTSWSQIQFSAAGNFEFSLLWLSPIYELIVWSLLRQRQRATELEI